MEENRRLLAEGLAEEALQRIEQAARDDPRNPELRAQVFSQREALVAKHLADAEVFRRAGNFDAAEAGYARVFRVDPANQRARAAIVGVQAERRWAAQAAEAEALLAKGDIGAAEQRLRSIQVENPSLPAAQDLARRIAERQAAVPADSRARAALAKPVTMEFREANIRTVFEVISRTAGMNFVFDKDVRPDTKVTIFVRNSSIEDVVKLVLATNQLEKKQLNENSMLIYPNTPAKQKEYQELVVRAFYLANADAKQTLAMLKTVLKTRDAYVDDKLNLLVMRDTPGAVRLAEKMIAAQDLAEPEVTLEVEVLEIKRSRLTDLGIQYPNQLTVLNIVPAPTTQAATGGVILSTTNATTTTTQLTLDAIRHGVKGGQVGIPNPVVNLRDEEGDTNLLANPRIRVKNREKAKIHIGDKVPVITTTSTANVGVSESVNYLDVGLKLDVEPSVFLDNEVSIKVGLEVSSIVREIRSTAGTLTYQVGTRNASTTLRLRDGETQVLAGLINDEDRKSASRLPGLGELPVVGRLFSSHREEKVKTEIVLLITPRVVRNLPRLEFRAAEVSAGTENAAGTVPLAMRPTAPGALALSSRGGAVTAPGPGGRAAAQAPRDAPPPPEENAVLVLSGAARAATGQDIGVGIALPPSARSAEVTLAYDATVLRESALPDGGTNPGRITLKLDRPVDGPVSLGAQLRVVGKEPAFSQITVDSASVRDASGRDLPVTLPAPIEFQVGK
jgi:general secretion pathway protein D